ncbi:MAG: NYN domain-containing protein [Chloroflexi bacterium]|nr:NYN domain-containing protein [Chloroflexota bacterium]
MRFNVYVDGFNLYYGALRGQPYRWLNLRAFAQRLVRPTDEVHRIRYFTALVRPFPNDPEAPERQATYLRALGTVPGLHLHEGQFLVSERTMLRADGGGPVRVIRSEEKGSDVNLATHLLLDAFDDDYEAALVISNDSDLAEPIRLVQERFRRPIGVVFPVLSRNQSGERRPPSNALQRVAAFRRFITPSRRRRRLLAECQFPETLTDVRGTFSRPPAWA